MEASIGEDYVAVHQYEEVDGETHEEEIVYWCKDEWLEDPESVVPAIANAIHLAYTEPEELKRLLKK